MSRRKDLFRQGDPVTKSHGYADAMRIGSFTEMEKAVALLA